MRKKKKRPQESHLTPRQWALWRLIEHNSLVEHRKTNSKGNIREVKRIWL